MLMVYFLDSTLPRALHPRWLRMLVVIDRRDVSKPDLWVSHERGHSRVPRFFTTIAGTQRGSVFRLGPK